MAMWEILTICVACASIAISLLALRSAEKTHEEIDKGCPLQKLADVELIARESVLALIKGRYYIDEKDLEKDIYNLPSIEWKTKSFAEGYYKGLEAQTVDLTKVLCRDCKHYNPETKGCKRNPSVEAWEESDYCNYGERRE